MSIDSIVPNPRNPKKHPPAQITRLAASIRRFGQPRDVLVRRANRMIVAGHGVTEACRAAGLLEINVALWDVDQPTADAFMLGDNRLGELGQADTARVRELLLEFGQLDPESMGFSADEVASLTKELQDQIDVIEIPTTDVQDRFWISVRGNLADQAMALKLLIDVMGQLPSITVEMGTIVDG